jgi:signal transduction histidine kinase
MSGHGSRIAAPRRVRRKYRPGLRTILALLNLTVLLLPFAGLVFFRIYEAHLVRETESELIGQAAMIAAVYKSAVRGSGADLTAFGAPVAHEPAPRVDGYFRPIEPVTDLGRDNVLPPRPDGNAPDKAADTTAERIGADLTSVLIDAQRVTLIGIRLLDHQGVVVGGRGDTGLSFAHVPEVVHAMTGQYAAVLRVRVPGTPQPAIDSLSRSMRVRVFIVYPVVEAGRLWGMVYLSRTPENLMRKLYFSRDRLLLAASLTIALALLLAVIAGRTISGPITALMQRARQMASGDARALAPLKHAGTRELADLSDSFSDMASALNQRATCVRDFAAHVSHELKTPLTSIHGAVELMSEHGNTMPEDARARFLHNIGEDTQRLRRLVDRLHELALAEHAATIVETIDLGAALATVREAHATASLQIDLDAAPGLLVRISSESFGMVADNIIANAVQSGATRLAIALSRQGGDAVIAFVDNGTGIAREVADRIFDPFFTTRRECGGTGLGLRIVRAILEANAGAIALAPSQIGATFAVQLQLVDAG